MIEFKVFFTISKYAVEPLRYLNNMVWIRIRVDPELLPGSGTQEIQSWIQIRNKSFRIHITLSNVVDSAAGEAENSLGSRRSTVISNFGSNIIQKNL